MNLDKYTEKEREFLRQIEIPCDEYGVYLFISGDGSVWLDLQYILMEYKQWLIDNKIVKQ